MASRRDVETGVPGAAALRLDDDFGFAIGTIFRAYVKAVEAALDDTPGGPRGYQVLAAAVQGDAGSQRSLARRLGVDRTVMTYLLDDLERAGLVERRPDPADRRNRHIVVTEHGREHWAKLRSEVGRVEHRILGVLPDGPRQTFRDLLCEVAGHVNAHDRMPPDCQEVADLGKSGEQAPTPRNGRRRSTS